MSPPPACSNGYRNKIKEDRILNKLGDETQHIVDFEYEAPSRILFHYRTKQASLEFRRLFFCGLRRAARSICFRTTFLYTITNGDKFRYRRDIINAQKLGFYIRHFLYQNQLWKRIIYDLQCATQNALVYRLKMHARSLEEKPKIRYTSTTGHHGDICMQCASRGLVTGVQMSFFSGLMTREESKWSRHEVVNEKHSRDHKKCREANGLFQSLVKEQQLVDLMAQGPIV